ncbi:uncharacterized protein LOC117338797 [Pecten maximus]|uniref:uncharacterized protein LOC117338797 n=1 Tax=Pecten maximus TaxID=6579 RepID=UPI001458E754|nr:uncharacterized protein LOC117338797 [Pecten maximus]
MVKSTTSESLDEAFQQRLTIIDEPWLTGCRLAETRLSRRDQHVPRHGQRRPSSEVRNKVKSRRPLPENKPEQNESTANERKRLFQFDGDQVHQCIQPAFDTPKRSRGSTYGKYPSSDVICPQRGHTRTPVDGPTPSHHSNNMGNRQGDRSNVVLGVEGQVFLPPDNDDHFTDNSQTHKRKLIDTCEIVYDNKRISIGCKGVGSGLCDVIADEDKVCLKRQHDDGGSHCNNKRQRPQLFLGQSTDDFDDIDDTIADSMSYLHSSLYEP